ncbi:uncharacterized protein Z519_12101 [Cladophialophora bantiana CBS 173.52]|uniref:Uncharacterized protein n=1 Tax=Cladophialophora bantiana (strain ATCC 10958 / CBS 173.52 / CDC B-1940 / NIH 8579) TaxID=1442370 RepID=A0A0D2HS48_CLAB1|nr:uncharacterized protein Z519_12101 [Cladophialophora bantiana CBS 173.52]KIW87199.1 hypothetical protein Z519_12101 [Cladophialophora bantiana CBS 173.52]
MSESNISTNAWQRCSDMGLSNIEFTELTKYINTSTLERLPEDKSWLIPLCVIQNDRLCKMRFMYQSLDQFVELIHESAMYEIRDVFVQSAVRVNPWMGLLMEESGLKSMDAIMYMDWNMEKPVIGLSGWTLRRRARNYLIAAATSHSIKILYERVMVGPVSILKMDEYTDSNSHELLTRIWHESRNSHGSRNIGVN